MHKQAAYHWDAYKKECFWGRVWETPPVRPVHILFRPRTTESLGHSLPCSHWRQSRAGSLTLVSLTTKHKSLHWACNRHLSMVGLFTVPGLAGKTAPGDVFHRRQGLFPGHSGKKWVSSRILFEPSWSKKQETITFHIFLVLGLWQLRKSWNPALCSFIYVDVGELTSHTCSMTVMM